MTGQNSTATVYRITTGAKEVYASTPEISDLPCYIEPIDPKIAAIFDAQNAFTMFRAIFDDAVDVRVSDKIIDANGVAYIVLGVQSFNGNTDTPNSTEAMLTKPYAQS